MNYIVFDLEWNQCPEGKGSENPELPFEIIEIGAVKMNESGEILDTFHQFVRPNVYKWLHYRTREVIGLTARDLRDGMPFPEAARDFLRFCTNVSKPAASPIRAAGDSPDAAASPASEPETSAAEGAPAARASESPAPAHESSAAGSFSPYLFFTWGTMDVMELQRNLRFYGLEHLIKPPVFFGDVQKLFAISYEERKLRRSLEYAVDFLKLSHEGDFHAALDDAMYTARVLQTIRPSVIRSNYSIDVYQYPRSKEEQIRIRYRTYEKLISRHFSRKEELMRDGEVSAVRCFVCEKEIRRTLPWTSLNHRNYEAVGLCPEHGYTKCKIRVRKTEEDTCFAIKTSRLLTEEEFGEIGVKYADAIKRAAAAPQGKKTRARRRRRKKAAQAEAASAVAPAVERPQAGETPEPSPSDDPNV